MKKKGFIKENPYQPNILLSWLLRKSLLPWLSFVIMLIFLLFQIGCKRAPEYINFVDILQIENIKESPYLKFPSNNENKTDFMKDLRLYKKQDLSNDNYPKTNPLGLLKKIKIHDQIWNAIFAPPKQPLSFQ